MDLKSYLDQGFRSPKHQKAFFSKVSTKESVPNILKQPYPPSLMAPSVKPPAKPKATKMKPFATKKTK